MSNNQGMTWRCLMQRALLTSAVAAAVTLTGLTACQSPVQPDAFEKNWGNYADSVLARGLADGSLNNLPVSSSGPTENQGVQELKSGQDSGDAGAIVPAGGAVPATNPAITGATTQTALNSANFGQSEPTIKLSLQEVIARALKHSLAIKVEAYNPGIKEAQITEALAAFDPVAFANSQYNNQDQPSNLLTTTTNGVTWQNTAGVRDLLPTGGTASATVGDTYRDLQNKFVLFPNSSHQTLANLTLTQPLLRGFGSAVTRANIYLAQRDHRIALTQFRRQVIKSISEVENAYHNLVLARATVDVQERLLANTQDTYSKIKARIPIDADRVSVKQAEAAVQARQAELVRATTNVRNASDQLKSLINDPELDLRGNLLIIPSDRPLDVPMAFNIGDQLDIALRQRTELQEARLQIQRADIVVNVARNDLLPKADVTISTQSNAYDTGFDRAFNGMFNEPAFIDYAVGGKLEIPLGNRQAEAAYGRRKKERRQAVTQMLLIAQQVILDVKTQLRDVLTSYQEIQARQTARVSAGEELNAIIQKEQVEKLTPDFLRLKLDSQQRLANAELLEVQALVNYNLALMKLETAKGTLLEYNRIAIDRPPEKDDNDWKFRLLGTTYGLENGKE
ncbi:MAG: TolC family protein, partial [Phycisphaerae bacterium]